MQLAFLSTAHVHTEAFLKAAQHEIAGAEAMAIWDDVPDRARAYAAKFDVPFVADLETVLSDDRVDGFVICAENTRHLPLLEKVLPIGKPTLCEKPLATRAIDARRIRELTDKYGTTLMSGYFQPFNGMNGRARQLITEGTLGRLTHAHFRIAHNAAYGRWFDAEAVRWFHDPQLAGGGAMMDMGTHAVHLLRHLCGPAKRVFALADNVSGVYDAVDDYGLMLIEFANGVLGRAEAGWCSTSGVNGLELIGSEQSIWQSGADLIMGTRDTSTQAALEPADPRPDRIHRLCAAIEGTLGQAELAEDLAASLDAVVIMEAAYTSAREGAWQDIPAM